MKPTGSVNKLLLFLIALSAAVAFINELYVMHARSVALMVALFGIFVGAVALLLRAEGVI